MNAAAKPPVRPFADFLRVLVAPAIWFAHFSLLYAAEALVCSAPPAGQASMMGWAVGLGTAAALIGLAILVVRLVRARNDASPGAERSSAWLQRTSLLLAILSMIAVVWTTLPTAVLPACA